MNKHRFARILNTVMLALVISVVDLLTGCTQAQYTEDAYSYTYIVEPAPDSGYCIRFDTDAAPEGHDLAKDFTTSIQYFVDGTEVVPEIPGD